MDRRILVTTISTVLVMALRLVPYMYTETLFSTDSWGLLRDSIVLTEHSPIDVRSGSLFDGYNNYWPGAITALSASKIVTGVPYVPGYLLVTLASTMCFIIAFSYMRNRSLTPAGILLPGTVFSTLMMTAGFTKEGASYGFFGLLIYLVFAKEKSSNAVLVSILLLAGALVLYHHLTAVVLASILIGFLVVELSTFFTTPRASSLPPAKFIVGLGVVTIGFAFHYYFLASFSPIRDLLDYWYVVKAVAWMVALGIFLLGIGKSNGASVKYITPALFLLGLLAYIALIREVGVGVDAGLVLVTIASIALIVSASKGASNIQITGWLIGVTALVAVMVFENTAFFYSIIYRVLAFLLIAFTVREATGSTARVLYALAVVASVVTFIATVSGVSTVLGWHWVYYPSQVTAGEFLAEKSSSEETVCTDVKYSYLLRGMYGISAREGFIGESCHWLILDSYMFEKGALISPGKSIVLNNLSDSLKERGLVIYSSGGMSEKWVVSSS